MPKTNPPFPGSSSPLKNIRTCYKSKCNQDGVWPSYLGGRSWSHGCCIQDYWILYDLRFVTILYNSLGYPPNRSFNIYPTLTNNYFISLDFFQKLPLLKRPIHSTNREPLHSFFTYITAHVSWIILWYVVHFVTGSSTFISNGGSYPTQTLYSEMSRGFHLYKVGFEIILFYVRM